MAKESMEDIIEHFGVKGMKWGVRRSEKTKAAASKTARSLTDDELKAKIARLRLEEDYVKLSTGANQKKILDGEGLAKKLVDTAGNEAIKAVVAAGATVVGTVVAKKFFKG